MKIQSIQMKEQLSIQKANDIAGQIQLSIQKHPTTTKYSTGWAV